MEAGTGRSVVEEGLAMLLEKIKASKEADRVSKEMDRASKEIDRFFEEAGKGGVKEEKGSRGEVWERREP